MPAPLNRLREADPRLQDAALAAALMLGYGAEFAAYFDGDTVAAIAAILGLPGIAALCLRRTRPLVCGYALATLLGSAGSARPTSATRWRRRSWR